MGPKRSATILGNDHRVPGTESGRRLLNVLLSFSESRPLWTVTELASTLELSPSMVYRYIALLREVGLVDGAPDSKYRVTDLAASLAAAAGAARAPLGEAALPVLLRLRDAIDETVLVARRSGWRVFTVDRVESRKPVRLQFEPGQAMNLHTGSMPRVLLATMSPSEREKYLASLDEQTRSAPALSRDALDQVATEGVTESFEEIDEGIWGVGAAIVVKGETLGAIGCAAPIYRNDADKRRMIRELVVGAAGDIARSMS
ncbi:DNA-binding IclR family transcriptional regulator [Mycetocola sp. 2940]